MHALLAATEAFLHHLRRSAADDALVDQILASTQHPLALDAFVSILFAPQARLSFDGMVAAMQCPVCMIYGREDPWVVPLWGQRLKRLLADAVYLEVRPPAHSASCLLLLNSNARTHCSSLWKVSRAATKNTQSSTSSSLTDQLPRQAKNATKTREREEGEGAGRGGLV